MSSEGLAHTALQGREWRDGVDALVEAVRLVVCVLDSGSRSVVFSTDRCSHCDVATADGPHESCLGEASRVPDDVTLMTCRGSLPCYVAPIAHADRDACTLVVGGFVSSTRERNRLFAKLASVGVQETAARTAARAIPLVPRRQVEALARMLAVQASATLSRASENARWATRVRELELFVEAGTTFGSSRNGDAEIESSILERAMGLVSADCGTIMLLRPGTDILEVVAALGEACVGALHARVHLGEGISGRVARTGRSVLVTGDRDEMLCHSLSPGRGIRHAISVPLKRGPDLIGVLNLGMTNPERRFLGEEIRLIDRFAALTAVVIDNVHRQRASERITYEVLKLNEYARSVSTLASSDEIVSLTVSVLEKAFDFELAGVVVTGWGREDATVVLGTEVPENVIQSVVAEAAGWYEGEEALGEIRYVTHLAEPGPPAADFGDWSVFSSEIMAGDTIVGYAFLASHEDGAFCAEDKRMLDGIADHAAAALCRAALFERLRNDFTRTISALSATLDAGERVPRGHSDRVMDYAMAIGEELGLAREDVEVLRFAGLLHDVGKMGLSEEILLKPSRLSEEEMEEVRRHAEIGASIVEQLELLDAVTPVILHHHEHWNGGGYPHGLAGDEIPLLARILSVADAFDVMTSERPYRRRLSYAEARQELRSAAGVQFDPRVVSALIDALEARALVGRTGLLAELGPEDHLPA
ncbi:MAG: HD domain-containing protein [Coriobacteriia bacterium]|nr:HD domain-containing protein [Coriobacteriia bacterium]